MDHANVGRSFYDILKALTPDLAAHIDEIKKRGLEDWVHFLTPEFGSHSGYPHLLNVERIANQIVPDSVKDNFGTGEILLLLSAIFLHDIGKTIPARDDPEQSCDRDPDNCPLHIAGKKPPCYKPQWNHFKLGEEIIQAQGIALGLPDERIVDYCGLLVFCHGLRVPPLEKQPVFIDANKIECVRTWRERGDYRNTSLAPYGTLRIPLLASILRIADETDNSWTRAVRDYWFKLQKQNPSNVGKAFRRCIEDIEFCHEGQCLILHVPEMDDMEDEPALRKTYTENINNVRQDITTVLKHWGQELAKIGVRFDDVYIEYHNHLFKEFHPVPHPTSYPTLCEVLDDKHKHFVRQMLEAMIQLSLGSYEYPVYNWEMLEAQVGRPLTDVDKWLAGRIANASGNRILITEHGEIRLEFSRKDVSILKKLILS